MNTFQEITTSAEETRHDLLLIIVTALFILFATGLGVPATVPGGPIVIP